MTDQPTRGPEAPRAELTHAFDRLRSGLAAADRSADPTTRELRFVPFDVVIPEPERDGKLAFAIRGNDARASSCRLASEAGVTTT